MAFLLIKLNQMNQAKVPGYPHRVEIERGGKQGLRIKLTSPLNRQDFVRRYASQFVDAEDRIFDQVVRTRSAGRDANDRRTNREPVVGHDFSLFVEVVVRDAFCGLKFCALRTK